MTAKYEIKEGDCMEILKQLPDNYYDAILSDPPYGISFFGKKWDTDVPPKEVWAELLRVCKPGARIIAFSGARKFHRLFVNIEDAGWEIKDCLMWLYGCVDEETEILTKHGWRKYNGVDIGDEVATWNINTEQIELQRVQDKLVVPDYEGKMHHIKNSMIDALVTPNHRVYHKYHRLKRVNGKTQSKYTGWLAKEAQRIVPSKGIRIPVAAKHIIDKQHFSIGTSKLIGYATRFGTIDYSTNTLIITISTKQSEQKHIPVFDKFVTDMNLNSTKESVPGYRSSIRDSVQWKITGDIAKLVINQFDKETGLPKYSLIWKLTEQEKQDILDVYNQQMYGEINVPSSVDSIVDWLQTLVMSTGRYAVVRSHDSKNASKRLVAFQDQSTTDLYGRKILDSTVDYKGLIWCVSVPNGAIVIRRNGYISITGNSGFPKGNLDIGKHLGEPWKGYGTTLKPAWEPIVLASKPLDSKYLENAQKWRVAGINIDGTRVESSDKNTTGRWPSNLLIDQEVANDIDKITGIIKSKRNTKHIPDYNKSVGNGITLSRFFLKEIRPNGFSDEGGGSKFFYVQKAGQKERGEDNIHPTVKPIQLCSYLAKMIKPPFEDAKLLVPFSGSGSEMIGALEAGWNDVTGIEIDPNYIKIAHKRISERISQRKKSDDKN